MKYNESIDKKLEVIKLLVNREISNREASEMLGLSIRQIRRMKVKYLDGAEFMHGNTGNTHAKRIDDSTHKTILDARQDILYNDITFAYFNECLKEDVGIDVSYATLHNILTSNNINSPRKHRDKNSESRHTTRNRRESIGELLQIDASKHQWFYKLGDNSYYNIHGFIDDATSKVIALYMTKNECFTGYTECLRQTLDNYGIPNALYADRHTIFFSPTKHRVSDIDANKTRFGCIADELDIELIHAYSPQAKGRIEHLWTTLQDRLPTEFAKHNIDNMHDANKFLTKYIHKYNKEFSVEPLSNKNSYRALPININLDRLLTHRFTRTLDNGACFSYKNTLFRVEGKVPWDYTKVTILISERIGMKGLIHNTLHSVTPIRLNKNPVASDKSSIDAIVDRFIYDCCLRNENTLDKIR